MMLLRSFHAGTALLVTVVVLAGIGCGNGSPSRADRPPDRSDAPRDYVSAIIDVLSLDSELGLVRNSATQSASLAEAIRGYVTALDSMDFSGCPDDFTAAFAYHRNAWEESIPFFEPFSDMRGEMHELFDQIRERSAETHDGLERVEVRIWDSWREVEAVAADHGAIEPPAAE